MYQAFDYLKNFKLQPLNTYPYENKDDTCRYNEAMGIPTGTQRYAFVKPMSARALETAIANFGVVSVGIDARNLLDYVSGIVQDRNICTDSINHAVNIVGYGVDESTKMPYWIVRNQWGHRWGEQGYVRVKKLDGAENDGGICGLHVKPGYPILS